MSPRCGNKSPAATPITGPPAKPRIYWAHPIFQPRASLFISSLYSDLVPASPAHRIPHTVSSASPQEAPSGLKWANSSLLAQERMEGMVDAYAQYISTRGSMPYVPPLVELTAELLGRISEEDFLSMNPVILDSNLWKWTRIPYTTFRAALNKGSSNDPKIDERIDEWVLSNEKWLRHRTTDVPWQCGLLRPHSIWADNHATQSLSGVEVLCDARKDVLTIQPSTPVFEDAFNRMTDGLLIGLDWTNVMVAGGMVLGTLVSVPDSGLGFLKLWNSSDIDLYIYGLAAEAATAKIHHIYQTLRNNLPPNTSTVAVKNSKTITFYAHYPIEEDTNVLLNFDLDICAVGWDGNDVWMLPRAARALEIRGHYLSERRASHPQRAMGYDSCLPTFLLYAALPKKSKPLCPGGNLSSLDIDRLATDARAWVVEKFTELRGSDRIRYSDMDEQQPCRNCLTGFSLFMRNVAYWEMMRRSDDFADSPAWAYISYEDTVRASLIASGKHSPSFLQYDDNPKQCGQPS
ncbi:hypothetical protein B0H12DRAFT_1081338 [Mycena haematopus]|nr:hypothetical protein B0H12DRAFT_1081338 [Mycena haematopus]